ncbi:ABC transporter substrate-binding protein [Pseudofrankia sp. BMG5.36]|uniref:ABC transporter substrate-binding protein n=1 Tax=Pseudofrankia sp. BMG5.36 TaxID=1834512 RepID=UPI0012FFA767|nr:ABC transporter substrate-binding protein [Pseudofrankia sp. BMG5.36]
MALKKSRSCRRIALTGVVAALVLSACGGGGSAVDSATGNPLASDLPPAGAGPTPTGTPITIGLIASSTGAFSETYAPAGPVSQAWADMVNKELGGINGHPVTVKVYDDQLQADKAAAAAREAVEQDGVVAIAIESSVAGPAIADYLDSKGVPIIGGVNFARSAENSPSTWFGTDIQAPQILQTTANVAKDAGLHSTVGVVCSEVPECAAIGKVQQAYAPKVGIDYKGTVTMAADDTSATAQCLQIVNEKPGGIAGYVTSNPLSKLLVECRTQGYTGPLILVSTYAKLFESLGDTPMYGMSTGFPWFADAAPAKQFRDAVQRYGHGVDYRGYVQTTTWSTLELFRKAMQKDPASSADVTSASVLGAYRQVKDETLDGLLPQPLTFTKDGPSPAISCFWTIERDSKGEFKRVAFEGKSGNGAKGDLASECVQS